MKFAAVSLLLLLLVCGFVSQPASAQVLYGSVIGTVTDPSGAIIPNAKVSITSKDTGQSREDTADESGRYSFVNVLPGNYTLKVQATGFRAFAANDVAISPNTVQRLEVKLEVGQLSDQVTVEANAVSLQTEKADTHGVLDSKTITNMPLGGYRNYQSLINLVPGAMPAVLQNSITDTPGRSLRTNINGGNANTNVTRIDGAASVNVWLPPRRLRDARGKYRRREHHHRFRRCGTRHGRLFRHHRGHKVRHERDSRKRFRVP